MKIKFLLLFFLFFSLSVCARESLSKKRLIKEPVCSFVSVKDRDFLFDPLKMDKSGLTLVGGLQPQRKSVAITTFIVPTLCIAYGTVARFNNTPVRKFDKYIAGQVDKHVTHHYGIDNGLQLLPAMLGYGLDFIPGIESRHNFRDRTLIFATSYAFMGAVVLTTKEISSVMRPRAWEGEYDSFPSGHTSVAFTGAHLLYKEYKGISPWIGVGGYAIATATAALRVINRAHWVSDVVTAAGVGILSAEVGYLMLPVWHRMFNMEDSRQKSVVLMPAVSARNIGLGMVYVF